MNTTSARVVPLLLLSSTMLAACTGTVTNPPQDGGPSRKGDACSPVPAAVYLASTLGPTPPQSCSVATTTTALSIGSVMSSLTDGTSGLTLQCSVAQSGALYDVQATLTSHGDAFTVSGKVPGHGTGSGVAVSLDYSSGGGSPVLYSDSACTITLANGQTPGFDPATGPPIAPGRVWATVTCPDMTTPGQGGSACTGTFVFRLENCAPSTSCP